MNPRWRVRKISTAWQIQRTAWGQWLRISDSPTHRVAMRQAHYLATRSQHRRHQSDYQLAAGGHA